MGTDSPRLWCKDQRHRQFVRLDGWPEQQAYFPARVPVCPGAANNSKEIRGAFNQRERTRRQDVPVLDLARERAVKSESGRVDQNASTVNNSNLR